MEMIFYGNELVQQTLRRMIQRNRTAHGFLFYGDPGLGKKTLARRTAAALLCSGAEKPCGVCKSCRMFQDGVHPDVICAETSGKLGGFSADTVRQICTDLATPPNEGDAKCCFFFDCDKMDPRSQNLLLKAIEEPQDYAYFFFTAQSPAALLPTVRSRIIALPLGPVSEEQCRSALEAEGFAPQEIQEAVGVFHGNIGRCKDFLQQEPIRTVAALTKSAINSIISRNEYTFLQAAAVLGKQREQALLFLTLFDRTIRDAMARKYDASAACIGCDAEGAARLSERLSAAGGQAMHLAVDKAYAAIQANVNLPLALSALCASCMDAC